MRISHNIPHALWDTVRYRVKAVQWRNHSRQAAYQYTAGQVHCCEESEMKRRGMLYVGVLLVTLGVIFMLIQFTQATMPNLLGWRRLWPLLVLFVGLAFWLPLLLWWPQRASICGLAMPATIITANGLLLLYQSLTGDWGSWAYMWAIEPLAVGVGLLAIYALGPRDRGLLTAAGVVGGIGLVMLMVFGAVFSPVLRYLLPALLIVAGLVMFLRGSRQRAAEDGPTP